MLYESAFPRVYRALVAVLLDRETALDAVQDAFAEGLRRGPPERDNLEGWLYRVALRRARRGLFQRSRPVTLAYEPQAPDALQSTLDRLEVGELLSLLSQRQRAVVVAHYYLDLSHEQIAAQLGIRRGTVGATISQALARMRKGGVRA